MIQVLQNKYPAIRNFRTDCQTHFVFGVNVVTLSCRNSSSDSFDVTGMYARHFNCDQKDQAICTSSSTLPFSHLIMREGKVRII